MRLTSSDANKEIKKLRDQFLILKEQDRKSRIFSAASGEDPEKLRPENSKIVVLETEG